MFLSDLESQAHPLPASDGVAGPVVVLAAIERRSLDAERHMLLVDVPTAGANVIFTGQVRDHDDGRRVSALEYSAHPNAATVLETLAREAVGDGIRAVAVSHRVGRLEIGETAVCCAVSADHRRQAFDACLELVEAVKHRLPVWKHQIFADGTDEWVGSA